MLGKSLGKIRRRLKRQPDEEGRALALGALHPNASTVSNHHLPEEVEPDPHPWIGPLILTGHPNEPVENLRVVGRRNANPKVLLRQLHSLAVIGGRDNNFSIVW